MKSWWKIALALIALVCSFPFVVSAWFVGSARFDDWIHHRSFEAEAWKNQDRVPHDPHWPPRLCMLDDLLASGRLDGLTEAQILDLLGPPEDRLVVAGESQISYYLGPERSFLGIDSETLVVAFGSDEKLRRSWIHRD
jgi:hypothetical protein